MAQFSFGAGNLYGIPSGTNPTPVLFGTLQEVSVDISFSVKELYGQNQFPVAIGRGQAKVTGKAKAANISSQAFNTLFTGQATNTGGLSVTANESKVVTAGSATVTNTTNFADDLGVIYGATGVPLTRVASAPTVGQYSVNTTTGVYTFNVTDNSATVLISYSNTVTTGAKNAIITNQLMGVSPTFSVVLGVPYSPNSTNMNLKFYSCTSTKLGLTFKNEDFTVPEFEFQAFANAAGNIYQLTTNE